MKYSAVIVAAGRSQRFGAAYSKMLYQFADGSRVIDRSLRLFMDDADCGQLVAVVNTEVMQYLLGKDDNSGKVVYCLGGANRCDSVYNGLLAVNQPFVLVHDGARPFLSCEQLDRIKQALAADDAVIPAVRAADTIKKVAGGYVAETMDRQNIFQAQTPQGFAADGLLEAYKKALDAGFVATDEAQVIEKFGRSRVFVVSGSPANRKITTMQDVK